MNFKPSNFYISIIDLFAILLPGAIAALVIYNFYDTEIDTFLGTNKSEQGFYDGCVLLFSSYLLGHIISQISAYMDEWIYDVFKEKVFKDRKRLKEAMRIREEDYENNMNPVLVNTYKWCLFKIQKEQPYGAAEIERYMADSKFFRGLFIVVTIMTYTIGFQNPTVELSGISIILLVIFIFISVKNERKSFQIEQDANEIKDKKEKDEYLKEEKAKLKGKKELGVRVFIASFIIISLIAIFQNIWVGLICFLLSAFSMIRYFKKRRKATETAYQYIIFSEILNSKKKDTPKERVLALVSMDKPLEQVDIISSNAK